MPIPFQTSLEEEFRASPPRTTAEVCRHYDNFNFAEFCGPIDDGLDNIPTKHRPQFATLMTHNFQHFCPASFFTARSMTLATCTRLNLR